MRNIMIIKVIAHPNSKNPRVEKDLFGDLRVYVKEPALEGRANEAVIVSLAEYFGVKKYQVLMVRGQKSKKKIFRIQK